MQDTIRYLVGDQFEKFANHPQVITLAELEVSLNCCHATFKMVH